MTFFFRIIAFTLCLFGSVHAQDVRAEDLTGKLRACGSMERTECDVFLSINLQRQAHGAAPLLFHKTCYRAAVAHAKDMVSREYFDHDSPTETWEERMARFKLDKGASVGENIAYNHKPGEVVTAWMKSSGHKKNILNKKFTHSGLALYKKHWVQCFYAMDPNGY